MQTTIEAILEPFDHEIPNNWCIGHYGFISEETYLCYVYNDFVKQTLPSAMCIECAKNPHWRKKLLGYHKLENAYLLSESYEEE